MTRSRRLVAALSSAALAVGSAGCSGAEDATAPPLRVVTEDYRPGVAADVVLPVGVTAAPVVVLVPGGAWLTADRTGLTPLAQLLARNGIVAVNTTHRAVGDGARFPGPVSDVVCAVDFAVERAREAGVTPGAVVLLGHSSGAHLAALAALGTDRFRESTCPYPAVRVDGFVGLAGAYDVTALPHLARPLFGATEAQAPDAWRTGNPLTFLEQGSNVRAYLAHGTADRDLPPSFTTRFAGALEAAGYDLTVAMVADADHHTIYAAEVIGPRLVDWLRAPKKS